MTACQHIYRRIIEDLDTILSLRQRRSLKTDGSYVTEGDLYCQAVVAESLHRFAPGCTVISEEMDTQYDGSGDVAVVDPIDGTENFTSGLPEWGVSVSIYRQGLHVESMLALPELNRVLTSGDSVTQYSSRIHGFSSSVGPRALRDLVPGCEYRVVGCAVYNFYSVITGSFCAFENPVGANCWDILAGLNLSAEHGLEVTVDGRGYKGEFLPPTKRYSFLVRNVSPGQ